MENIWEIYHFTNKHNNVARGQTAEEKQIKPFRSKASFAVNLILDIAVIVTTMKMTKVTTNTFTIATKLQPSRRDYIISYYYVILNHNNNT